MSRILVIDDKPSMREMLETVLGLTHEVKSFGDPRAGLEAFAREPFDLVLTDVRMPELDGIEVLRSVKAIAPDAAVVVMTAYGTVAQAVESMRLGASDYIAKPFEPAEVQVVVDRALERRALEARTARLEREVRERSGAAGRLHGESAAMREVRALIDKVAPTDATVLISGPSGTGKELVARAVHDRSPRVKAPFVVVHCAALPRDLIESELFGHVRGAFSGAVASKRGLVDEAEGGTLFLDDVNYLDIGVQAKVNRLIQEKQTKPIGASVWKKVDVRIVASANVDLEALARRGEFREDLFYRLNVFAIRLPSLDARPEDIPVLARHFAALHGTRFGKPGVTLSPTALSKLSASTWRGNVRELENAMERALILVEGPQIEVEHLPALERRESPRDAGPSGTTRALAAIDLEGSYEAAVEQASTEAGRAYLQAVLERTGGNVSRAAERAGVTRQHMHRLLKKLGIADADAEHGV